MVNSGCFSPSFLGGGMDTGQGYFNDVFASMLDGPWMFQSPRHSILTSRIQTALMPAGPGGSISVVGGENIAVFKGSRDTEAALEFLRFTQSDEYQLKMSEVGQLTVKPALLENEYFQNHPYYGVFLEQLQTARAARLTRLDADGRSAERCGAVDPAWRGQRPGSTRRGG